MGFISGIFVGMGIGIIVIVAIILILHKAILRYPW
jgi:hypothetical protein